MPIEPKDWIELAKLTQGSIHNRREFEWKLAFGFWTAIGTFTAAFFTLEGFICPIWLSSILMLAYLLILGGVIFCWQIPQHSAHAGDREWYDYYMDRTRWDSSSDVPEPKPPVKHEPIEKDKPLEKDKPKWSNNNLRWCIGQCLFSAVFLALSWVAITQLAPMKAAHIKKAAEASRSPTLAP